MREHYTRVAQSIASRPTVCNVLRWITKDISPVLPPNDTFRNSSAFVPESQSSSSNCQFIFITRESYLRHPVCKNRALTFLSTDSSDVLQFFSEPPAPPNSVNRAEPSFHLPAEVPLQHLPVSIHYLVLRSQEWFPFGMQM